MSGTALAVVAGDSVASDALFDPGSRYNRDDCLRGFRLLKDDVERSGGRCHTADVFAEEGSVPDVVLHLDLPRDPADPSLVRWRGQAERWVFLQESEVIVPWNWDRSRHGDFAKVFTWNDAWVDGGRYRKLNHHVPFDRAPEGGSRTGEVVVIAGNKRSRHRLELYSARLDAIRWAERHRPASLDLYGAGWDRRQLPTRVSARLSRTRAASAGFRPRPSYRGSPARKQDVLARYRFSLCFENARDIPGYVTEKIFDVLLAGTVPIYRGADNITDHVPSDCFIDARAYGSWSALWSALETMEPARVAEYQRAGADFLSTPHAQEWSSEGFARLVGEHVT